MSINNHKKIHITEGHSPILISAPHAVPIKKRTKERTYIRRREARADELVKEVCLNTNSWGITTKSEKAIKNWRNKGGVYYTYRKTVNEIIKSKDICLFIDIHGARKTRPFLIDYDFIYPENHQQDDYLEEVLIKSLHKYFPKHSISNGFFRKINGPGTKTLTYHVRKKLGIPAVQLEINKALKDSDENFYAVAEVISLIVEKYKKNLSSVNIKNKEIYQHQHIK